MKISDMKLVASKRTPGEWLSNTLDDDLKNNWYLCLNIPCYENEIIADAINRKDAAFIALAANTYDRLLECADFLEWLSGVEQDAILEVPELWGHTLASAKGLVKALEAE